MDAVQAVLSGFEQAKLNPLHVTIPAVIGVVLFIFTIRSIVRVVVSYKG